MREAAEYVPEIEITIIIVVGYYDKVLKSKYIVNKINVMNIMNLTTSK